MEKFKQKTARLMRTNGFGTVTQAQLFFDYRLKTLRPAGVSHQQHKHVMAHLLHVWGAHEFAL